MRHTVIKSIGIIFLCCILTGMPLYALINRFEAYTSEIYEAINLLNTTFGVEDWTVTPPYKSQNGRFELGSVQDGEQVIDLWTYVEDQLNIDHQTHYGNRQFGYESYKVIAVYPVLYYTIKDGEAYETCIRMTIQGTYRSGLLGIFYAQTGQSEIYFVLDSDEFYSPNINGDALQKFPVTITWGALEENAEGYPYSAFETKTLTIDYLKTKAVA